jgi:hypothetical protein
MLYGTQGYKRSFPCMLQTGIVFRVLVEKSAVRDERYKSHILHILAQSLSCCPTFKNFKSRSFEFFSKNRMFFSSAGKFWSITFGAGTLFRFLAISFAVLLERFPNYMRFRSTVDFSFSYPARFGHLKLLMRVLLELQRHF